jgi:hypothetical protein
MAVELRPSGRPPSDYYFQKDNLKIRDLVFGFAAAALFWYLCFNPCWYAAPVMIFTIVAILVKIDIKRRYIAYGALCLLFLPLIIFGGGHILRNGMGSE